MTSQKSKHTIFKTRGFYSTNATNDVNECIKKKNINSPFPETACEKGHRRELIYGKRLEVALPVIYCHPWQALINLSYLVSRVGKVRSPSLRVFPVLSCKFSSSPCWRTPILPNCTCQKLHLISSFAFLFLSHLYLCQADVFIPLNFVSFQLPSGT